jgi:hypothetical protein
MDTDSGHYGFALLAARHPIRGLQTATAMPVDIALMLTNTDG